MNLGQSPSLPPSPRSSPRGCRLWSATRNSFGWPKGISTSGIIGRPWSLTSAVLWRRPPQSSWASGRSPSRPCRPRPTLPRTGSLCAPSVDFQFACMGDGRIGAPTVHANANAPEAARLEEDLRQAGFAVGSRAADARWRVRDATFSTAVQDGGVSRALSTASPCSRSSACVRTSSSTRRFTCRQAWSVYSIYALFRFEAIGLLSLNRIVGKLV